MRIGDAVKTSYIRTEGGFGWAGYKAPKGERFVFLLLGTHPKDSAEPFDPEKRLNAMGWRFAPGEDLLPAEQAKAAIEKERDGR